MMCHIYSDTVSYTHLDVYKRQVYTNLSVLGIELEEICRSLVEHPVRCDYFYVKMLSLIHILQALQLPCAGMPENPYILYQVHDTDCYNIPGQ